jgi:hypothetical protein
MTKFVNAPMGEGKAEVVRSAYVKKMMWAADFCLQRPNNKLGNVPNKTEEEKHQSLRDAVEKLKQNNWVIPTKTDSKGETK